MKKRFSRGYNELQVRTQPQLFTKGKSGGGKKEKAGMSRGVSSHTHTHTERVSEHGWSVVKGQHNRQMD